MIGEVHTTAQLGAAVRRERLRRGWTQAELAIAIGVTHRYLSELERGKPKLLDDRLVSVLARCGVQLLYEVADE